jgi:peptide/nickel transport system ATP-binding protein
MTPNPAGAAGPLLSVEHLTVRFGASTVVDDVTLALDRNEILCVVGESGSGKSVLSRAVLGLFPSRHVQPRGGRILLDGEDLLAASPARLRAVRGNRISMIFQEPMTALNPVLRIGRQIEEIPEVHRVGTAAERRQRALAMLEAVNLPEPEKILALIRDIQRKKGMGVIFVTHDFGVVAEIADRIAVMQNGRLVEQGGAGEVLGNPKEPYTRALLGAVPSLTPGPKRDFAGQAVILSVKEITKTYRTGGGLPWGHRRQVDALRGVSFDVRQGESLGIVGESGSGKSTLARCIVRLVDSDSGRIEIHGRDIAALGSRALRPVRRRMQMVFQDPFGSLNPRRTVGQLISEGPIVHGIAPAEAQRRTMELLELVGLDPRAAGRFPHEFSGGQRQRIGIARALALEPEILVADEPVSALDVSVQDQVLRLIADIRARLGLTVLFITHDLRVASQVCDSIVVMNKGAVVEYGAVADVYADPRHDYTRTLLAAVPGRVWSESRSKRPPG